MYKSILATLAFTATNAVKLVQTDYDCTTYTVNDTEVAFHGPSSATLTWTAPSVAESAVESYTVHMAGQEFVCDASPCTIDTSGLVLAPDAKVSASVVPIWEKDFVIPFPIIASPEVSVCPADPSQELADALKAKDEVEAEAALLCPVDVRDPALVSAFEYNSSALSIAAMYGYLDVVKELIALGADVNVQNPSRWNHNPLSYACYAPENQYEIVEALVAAGADLDQSEGGFGYYTALHVCAHENSPDGL